MISDRERRGIVEFLRDEADYWRDYNKDDDTLCMSDSDFTESILEAFGFDGTAVPVYEVFDKLADLVDRTTCRNLSPKPVDVFVLGDDGSRWVREDGCRKPIRKVEAWCVVDFGGVYGCSWVQPVQAFTDHCKASVCRYIREQRREKPRGGVSRPIDYIGSCVKRIEVVIDE